MIGPKPPNLHFGHWRVTGGEGKTGSREPSEEAVAVVQARDDGCLDQTGIWRCGEKWSDIRCILGMDSTGLYVEEKDREEAGLGLASVIYCWEINHPKTQWLKTRIY